MTFPTPNNNNNNNNNMSGMNMSLNRSTASSSSMMFLSPSSVIGGGNVGGGGVGGGASTSLSLASPIGAAMNNSLTHHGHSHGHGGGHIGVECEVNWDVSSIRSELHMACIVLQQRCLKLASKWAAEQLMGLPPPLMPSNHTNGLSFGGSSQQKTMDNNNNNADNNNGTGDDNDDSSMNGSSNNSNSGNNLSQLLQSELNASMYETDANILYAKSLLELGEYLHAASILSQPKNAAMAAATANGNNNSNPAHFVNVTNLSATTCHDIMTMTPPLPNLSKYGIYLRAYALYLAGEKRKEEDYIELAQNEAQKNSANFTRNPYLKQLSKELLQSYHADQLDAFGLYIFGMVLKAAEEANLGLPKSTSQQNNNDENSNMDRNNRFNNNNNNQSSNDNNHMKGNKNKNKNIYPSSHTILVESIIQFPYNWSAWLDLAAVSLKDSKIEKSLEKQLLLSSSSSSSSLGNHYMYHFFCAHLLCQHQAHEDSIMLYDRLMDPPSQPLQGGNMGGAAGPGGGPLFMSTYLIGKLGILYYHLRQFQQARACFQQLYNRDPYRIDDLDIYSNVLYVEEDKIALSQLAHTCVKIDKYRPETCCIIGNYYSLKQQRSKAVLYFQRALKLDKHYMSAWTLMGHEYVEMKNTAAAMESYRRAVNLCPNDYRAWYGLGQTYEFLNMPLYALFYYRKAVALRPFDSRMWCAMGLCFLALHRTQDAIRSYERAVHQGDTEGIATQKLAALYRQEGDSEKAAQCYLRHLELRYLVTNPHPRGGGGDTGAANASGTPATPAAAAGVDGSGPSLDTIVQQIVVEAPEAEALLYLASYHKKHGEYDTAALFCSRLLEYPGPEKEEAKAFLRELRSRKASVMGGGNHHHHHHHTTSSSATRRGVHQQYSSNQYQQHGGGGGGHRGNPNSSNNNNTSSWSMQQEESKQQQVESSFEFSP